MDIRMISANGFYPPDTDSQTSKSFQLPFDGLDRMIEDRHQELGAGPDLTAEGPLQERIPKAYHYLLEFWSKWESDILPPTP